MILITIPDGRLCADPKVSTLDSGSKVAKLRVATNYRVKDDDGQWVSEALFFDVDCWKSVDALEEYFSKGSPIIVWGELQEQSWTTRDGEQRTGLVVKNASWTFPPKNGDGEGHSSKPVPTRKAAPKPAAKADDFDDWIPF